MNRLIARWSEVGDPAIFDPYRFSWAHALEANWRAIRAELDAVLQHDAALAPLHEISPDHLRITSDAGWKSFFLHGYGIKSERNCARCPETTKLIERIPGLQTAFFSVIEPGKRLIAHKGVTKAILTCHLALIVPEDAKNVWIRVAEQRRNWEEGRLLLFDDTRKHEVWNQTGERRVVLLMHIRRPVRWPGAWIAGSFLWLVRHSPFIRDAYQNQRRWERQFDAAVSEDEARRRIAAGAP